MSIDYDLAAKLKAAGFPKLKNWEPEHLLFGGDTWHELYEPSLSELIAAVIGNRPNTFSLDFDEEWSLYEEPNKDGPWSARYYDLTPVGFYERGAKSAEIAVAKLWLTLKAKE